MTYIFEDMALEDYLFVWDLSVANERAHAHAVHRRAQIGNLGNVHGQGVKAIIINHR
jgi:UDP-glucose 4-epimerase